MLEHVVLIYTLYNQCLQTRLHNFVLYQTTPLFLIFYIVLIPTTYQQIEMGGFVESPDLSLRVSKLAFVSVLPKLGDRIEVDGTEYRITKVGNHPRIPLLTLNLSSTDE